MCEFCILFDFSTIRGKVENGKATLVYANGFSRTNGSFNFCPLCGSPIGEDANVSGSFPANLRRIRKMRGYTQEALGRALGIKRSAICKYEKGRTKPNIHQLNTLCRVLEVAPQELI